MSDQTTSPTAFARGLADKLHLDDDGESLIAWRVGSDVYATLCLKYPHSTAVHLNAVMRALELPPSFDAIGTAIHVRKWSYAGQQRGLHEVIDVYEPYKATLEYRKYDPARKEIT